MAEFFDVLIIGGGPAGSTAGTLLSKQGWNVAILEKEKFPRFKIGESLLPGSLCTFERMGVKKRIEEADVVIKHGGKIISACGTRTNRFLFKDVFRCEYPTAYQVERSTFDKILLDHAAESGCHVFEQTPVTHVDFDADGVTLQAGNAEYRARYMIDCSGRNSLISSRFKLRRNYPGDEVKQRVKFYNVGPAQQPALIVMAISDKVGHRLDRNNKSIVVLFNVDKIPKTISLTDYAGISLTLHPVLERSFADPIVKQSQYDANTGTFTIPPRTTAVFLERR